MSEKIDSEYIEIEIDAKSSCVIGTTKETNIEITIWEDDEIFITDKFGNETKLLLNEICEIGRIAKMYRDRRTFHLAHNKNE